MTTNSCSLQAPPELRFFFLGVAAVLFAAPAFAQLTVEYEWLNVGEGNWADAANWSDPETFDFVPQGRFNDDTLIGNGGTAVVSTALTDLSDPSGPGAVIVSNGSTVRIESTGVLDLDSSGFSDGFFQVGMGGAAGTLEHTSGGSLSADGLGLYNPGSSILLGGSSTLAISGDSEINRVLSITGPNVTYTTGSLRSNANGVYHAVITQASGPGAHSVIQVAGSAQLGGALEVDLSAVGAVSVGDTWDLVEAATLAGTYASITRTDAVLPKGQVLRVNSAPSGGTSIAQLEVANQLYLEVDANTGAIQILNSDSAAIDIDGYSIGSASGFLNPTNSAWQSLADASTPDWIEANPTNNRLSEVKISGSTGVSSSNTLSLGQAFSPVATELGQDLTDLTFTYTTPTGEQVAGEVFYTGASLVNDFSLIVDADGNAQIKNDSGFVVEIEGYQISTQAGLFSQTGWNSLNEQSVDGWVEANPTDTLLTELDINAATTFGGGAAFNIGDLFDGVVPNDLIFQYLPTGGVELINGSVVYGDLPALPTGLDGDFNGDDVVDAADYALWRNNLGQPEGSLLSGNGDDSGTVDEGDYLLWRSNYGAGSAPGASLATAPEPTGCGLLLVGFAVAAVRKRKRACSADPL